MCLIIKYIHFLDFSERSECRASAYESVDKSARLGTDERAHGTRVQEREASATIDFVKVCLSL